MAAVITAEPRSVASRVEKLNAASTKRVIDPDRDLPGALGDGQLVPDHLLRVACGLDLDRAELTPEQKIQLSHATIAAIVQGGVFFESALIAGFALELTKARDYTDPRVTYLLHEMGEETRHSRLFVRLLAQLAPLDRTPFERGLSGFVARIAVGRIIRLPAFLYTMVLAGEEIPDLFQKLASEDPETDPFLADVNRYHRQEEARHLAFARLRLPEVWKETHFVDRLAVRLFAPIVIHEMYQLLVHPAVYDSVGLPGTRTWLRARRHRERLDLLHRAVRPLIDALVVARALRPGRIPWHWRRLARIDRHARPVADERG